MAAAAGRVAASDADDMPRHRGMPTPLEVYMSCPHTARPGHRIRKTLHPSAAIRRRSIITNSVLTAASLAAAGQTRVRILGGQLRGLTQAAVGPEAVETLSTLRVDVALLGANGVSAAHGLSTPDPDEATVKRAMVRSARQVVALVDSSKIGQEHLVSFASLDDVDLLVTDVELPPAR